MKSFSYKYGRYFNRHYPVIEVLLKGPSGIISADVYVDSGASTSIFLPEVAHMLGINYTKGERHLSLTGSGAYIPLYFHKVPIKIGDQWIKVTVGFSPELGASINLLGQKDIFNRFKITFDARGKQVIFQPYSLS